MLTNTSLSSFRLPVPCSSVLLLVFETILAGVVNAILSTLIIGDNMRCGLVYVLSFVADVSR